MLRKLRNASRARWRFAKAWIRGGKPLWLWLAVAFMVVGFAYILPAGSLDVQLADRVRWSGLLFQFLGLATVVWGLNTSRRLFGRPSIWKAALQWLRRALYIIKPPKPVSINAHVQAGAARAIGSASVVSTTSGSSIEDRLAKLEGSVRTLEESFSKATRDIRDLKNQLDRRITTERNERVAGDRRVTDQLEAATIGGIQLELAGLAYLYLGILFASLPQETAYVLHRIGI